MTHLPHWLKKTFIIVRKSSKLVALYGAGITFVSGATFTVWQFGWTEFTKNETQKRLDLATYANYGEYLKNYNNTIQKNIAEFLSSKKIVSGKPSEKEGIFSISKNQDINELDGSYMDKRREASFNTTCKTFLNRVAPTTKSGFEALKSKDLAKYETIHIFFDSLGFSIDRDLINFETVFELFTYPAYWKDGDKWAEFDPFFELERCLKENWFGEKKSLDGYSVNFLKLGNNYHYKRLVERYKLLKGETKQLENEAEAQRECQQNMESKECAVLTSTLAEITEKIEKNKKTIESIHREKLRIESYSENDNLPPWNKLYDDTCSKPWFSYLPPNLSCLGKYEE